MVRIEAMVRKLVAPIIILVTFWIVAALLWQTSGNLFFLFNFGYIGTAVGVGIGLYIILPRKKKPSARKFTQLLVGIYLLCFLGLFKKENMQLEGFFFYLFSGFFAGSVIHYLIAKIVGPVIFNRGYCGWACWTAMILDLLPYKRNKGGRVSAKWELFRYFHFGLSLILVLVAWTIFEYRPALMDDSGFLWLIAGNIFYYLSAIILAFALRDNRAFCKYLCPITVVFKLSSRFSLLKIEGDQTSCTGCGTCSKNCPMDIDIQEYVKRGERVLSTECIFCLTCTTVCPENILDSSIKADLGGRELILRKQTNTANIASSYSPSP
jgi:ferredoxin-type protein NapH